MSRSGSRKGALCLERRSTAMALKAYRCEGRSVPMRRTGACWLAAALRHSDSGRPASLSSRLLPWNPAYAMHRRPGCRKHPPQPSVLPGLDIKGWLRLSRGAQERLTRAGCRRVNSQLWAKLQKRGKHSLAPAQHRRFDCDRSRVLCGWLAQSEICTNLSMHLRWRHICRSTRNTLRAVCAWLRPQGSVGYRTSRATGTEHRHEACAANSPERTQVSDM